MYAKFAKHELDMPFWDLARLAIERFDAPNVRAAIPSSIAIRRKRIESGLDVPDAIALRQTAMDRDVMITNLGVARFDGQSTELGLRSLWGPIALSGYRGDYTLGVSTVRNSLHLTLASRHPIDELALNLREELELANFSSLQ